MSKRLRERAGRLIEERLTKMERAARGEEPLPAGYPDDGRAYARDLKRDVEAYIHFAVGMGLYDYAQDKEILFAWARRGGAIG